MALTGPTAVGDIDSERNPSAMSAMASSGRPPISPQTVTAQFATGPRPTMSFNARSEGALNGSKRFATIRFSRSIAKRNCIRSFDPTEMKSAMAADLLDLEEERGHLEHDAELEIGRQRVAVPREVGVLSLHDGLGAGEFVARRHHGNMIRRARPDAAFRSARICARSSPGRSRPMRMARQPSAGFSSSIDCM